VDTCSNHERISLYVYPSIAKEFKVAKKLLFGAFLDRKPGERNVIPSALIRKFEIDRLFKDFKFPEKEDWAADVLMRCRVVEILLCLNTAIRLNIENPERYRKNATVDRAINYINAHLCENFSVSDLAKQIAVDKYYLCRAFKKSTGVTINEYISQKRIDNALHMLNDGANCTQACFNSGFTNYTSFYQYFKRYTEAA
jgi:AraC-like DNA-binding protein